MKQWIIIIIVILLFIGCQAQKEGAESLSGAAIDRSGGVTPTISEADNNLNKIIEDDHQREQDTTMGTTAWYTDISSILDNEDEIQELSDNTEEILAEYGRLLSGSWSEHPEKVDGEREMSWGIVPLVNQGYTLIDFAAEQPLYVIGMSEGGSIGYDSLVGEIRKIKIEAPDTFRVYYIDSTTSAFSGVESGDFLLKYDRKNDTISRIERGSVKISSPEIQYRVSERLE